MSTTEKRSLELERPWEQAKVILLDIEGTTTSISFVKDELFPYVRTNLEKYVKEKWTDEEFKKVYDILVEQASKDIEEKLEGAVSLKKDEEDVEKAQADLVLSVLWQMDADRKTDGLKQLQGHIYREGYSKESLKGHIYTDVKPALKQWKAAGTKVYIYSSGSVEAQKLLFGHSQEGDLLEFISGHFDTAVGAKGEADSYSAIAKQLDVKPEELVFFTDILAEAQAAQKAGVHSVIVEREGNAVLSDDDKLLFPIVKGFEQILEVVEGPTKKAKVDESTVETKVPETEVKEAEMPTDVDMTEQKESNEEEKKMEISDSKKEENKEEEEKKVTEEVKNTTTDSEKVKDEIPMDESNDSPKTDVTTDAEKSVEEKKAEEIKAEVVQVDDKPATNGTSNTTNGKTENGTNGVEANGENGHAKEEVKPEDEKSASKEATVEVTKKIVPAAGDAPAVAEVTE